MSAGTNSLGKLLFFEVIVKKLKPYFQSIAEGKLQKSPLSQSNLASLYWAVFSRVLSRVSSVVTEVKLLSVVLAKLLIKDVLTVYGAKS